MYVHQLIAMTFRNHIPDGHKLVVNHINFNRLDNRSINLEVITQRENLIKKGKKRGEINYKDLEE